MDLLPLCQNSLAVGHLQRTRNFIGLVAAVDSNGQIQSLQSSAPSQAKHLAGVHFDFGSLWMQSTLWMVSAVLITSWMVNAVVIKSSQQEMNACDLVCQFVKSQKSSQQARNQISGAV